MSNYVFSPTTVAFYSVALKPDYEKSGIWPADAVVVTDDTWHTYVSPPPAGKTLGAVNGQPGWVSLPPPTLAQQAGAMMYDTVDVTSAAEPSLNSTYAIDPTSQNQITSIAAAINAGMGLPGGGDSFNWADVNSVSHQWPSTQFLNFARDVMNFVYACGQVVGGYTTTLPSKALNVDD